MKTTLRKIFTYRMALMLVASLALIKSVEAQTPNCANDSIPPSIFCVGLNTAFMPGACMVELWAEDFIYKASNNPNGTGGSDGIVFSFDPEGLQPNMTFFSDEGFTRNVRVYARDACGNVTFCEVPLSIDDNTGECPGDICDVDVNPWCGYAVVTCSAARSGDPIASIIDVRRNSTAPRGDNWTKPFSPTATPVKMISPQAWTLGAIGMVYGIAINPRAGEIFLAASDIYAYDFRQFVSVGFPPPSCSGPAGPGGIYKSNFDSVAANIVATPFVVTDTIALPGNVFPTNAQIIGTNRIPNTGNTRECNVVTIEELLDRPRTGNGLGNVAYDKVSDHVFTTNLEDGRIYSINNKTGLITDIFDPFTPYNHAVSGRGLVDSTERIWGIQVMNCDRPVKVIFARENAGPGVDNLTNRPKQIYQVTIDRDGKFVENDGQEELLFTVQIGRQKKFTDLAFNSTCDKLLLAERGDDHKSRVFEYELIGGQWQFGKRIFLGINDDTAPRQEDGIIRGSSAAGGVSYGATEANNIVDLTCDGLIWATMNCGDIVADPGRCDIYGLEGVNAAGNDRLTNGATDIFIDFDSSFTNDPLNFKSNIGEVEIFNCCCIEDEGRHILNTSASAIYGNIITHSRNSIANVVVALAAEHMTKTTTSNTKGTYAFGDLNRDREYMITPKKTDDLLDGISTLDLILIQQHVLGIRSLQSPYDLIAADVNGSKSITTADIVELRRALLGITDRFTNNDSWVFLPARIDFAQLESPLHYENYLMVQTEKPLINQADFIGIKVGDINGDNRVAGGAKVRSAQRLNIEIIKQRSSGNTIRYVFKALSDVSLTGLQLNMEGLLEQALSVNPGSISLSKDNYNMINDELLLSWNSIIPIEVSKGDILFTITADRNDRLRVINSRLQSEAYNDAFERMDINEMYTEASIDEGSISIHPNPFTNTTIMSLRVNTPQDISVSILDQAGRLIHNYALKDQNGLVQLEINNEGRMNSVPTGVYFVRIQLADDLITKRIVKIE